MVHCSEVEVHRAGQEPGKDMWAGSPVAVVPEDLGLPEVEQGVEPLWPVAGPEEAAPQDW